jgi:protein-tyrosine phosphatase
VADLRHPGERAKAPSFWADDHADRILAHGRATDQTAPHLSFFGPGMTDFDAIDQRYGDFYRDLPFNPVYQSLYAEVLNRMASGATPVLIHCSAGKDRTGLLVALILKILGVPFDTIVADYLQSKDALTAGPLRAQLMERAAEEGGIAPGDGLMDAVLGVKAEYLAASFAEIDRRCGSLTSYLDTIGVDASARALLARHLVTDAAQAS